MTALLHISHSASAQEEAPTTKPLFPIYDMMESWAAFAFSTPDVKPTHHALYHALIYQCKVRRGMRRFPMAYQHGMQLCGIGSKSTYLNTLRDLQTWGFITYEPGANAYKTPIVEVHFRESTGNLLDLYRYSFKESTETSAGRNKEDISKEDKKIEVLSLVAAPAAESELGILSKRLSACKSEADILEVWNSIPADQRPAKGSKQVDLFRQRKEEVLAGFPVFWDAYDHKVGSKAKAEKQWDRIDFAVRQHILAGLKTYKQSISDKQFQPHATTFLNGKLWEAETYGKGPTATASQPMNLASPAVLSDDQRQRQLAAMRARNANQPTR